MISYNRSVYNPTTFPDLLSLHLVLLMFLPAGYAQSAQPAGPRITLCFHIYIFVHPHVHNNYVTYIVAMQPYFSWLRQFRRLLCVATLSIPAQLQVWLRSRGNVDATMWGWPRVEMPEASSYSWCLQSLANREWPGELWVDRNIEGPAGFQCSRQKLV